MVRINKKTWAVVLLLASALFIPRTAATEEEEDVCGTQDTPIESLYKIGSATCGVLTDGTEPPAPVPQTIRVGIIYITFPDATGAPDPTIPGVVDLDRSTVVPGNVETFFDLQSDGLLDYEFDVILRPGGSTDMWLAPEPYSYYRNLVPDQAFLDQHPYGDCYRANCLGTAGGFSLAVAEVLDTIHDEYQALSPPQDPFADVDELTVIFSHRPWSALYGGCASGIGTKTCPQLSFTTNQGIHMIYTQNATSDGVSRVLSHELGHRLGLYHTTANPSSNFYPYESAGGPYSLMAASGIGGHGPYGIRPDQLLDLKWSTAEVVTESMRDVVITDFRRGGLAYRVPIAACDECNGSYPADAGQSFMITYHSGLDEDAYQNLNGTVVYPSTGLQIWHAIDYFSGSGAEIIPNVRWDLESAVGRYELDANGMMDPNKPNPIIGKDHLNFRRAAEPGAILDFFNLSDGILPDHSEFSYRTNPNTFAVGDSCSGIAFDSPQSVPNSVLIRIKKLLPAQDAAIIDILLAPYEDILVPDGGETLMLGDPYEIRWAQDVSYGWDPAGQWFQDAIQVIDEVDIYYSPSDGAPGTYTLLAAGEPNDGSYTWTPTVADLSSTGRIKIVYKNIFSSYEEYDESDESFLVVDPGVVPPTFQDGSAASGILLHDEPYSAVAIDYDADGDEDLVVSMQDATLHLFANNGETTGELPTFYDATTVAFGPAPYNARGLSAGDFDNDGDTDLFVAMGPDAGGVPQAARLYRNDGGSFVEDNRLPSTLTDAWSGSWGDFDNDGNLDLFVTRASASTATPAGFEDNGLPDVLLRSDVASGGDLVDVTAASGLFTGATETASAIWVDLENDGDLDLVAGWFGPPDPASPTLHWTPVYQNSGSAGGFTFTQVANGPGTNLGRLGYVSGVTFGDYNADGYWDVALARQKIDGTPQQNLMVCYNDGTGVITIEPGNGLFSLTPMIDLANADFDLNGVTDLLATPIDGSPPLPVSLKLGDTSGGSEVYLEFGPQSQLGPGTANAVVAADFNRDGDIDVFLGRSHAPGQPADFLFGNEPGLNFQFVRVVPNGDGNLFNASAIGATVRAEATGTGGGHSQNQFVDGGSGRGGQSSRALTFGLRSATGADLTLNWSGTTQQVDGVPAGATVTTGTPLVMNATVSGMHTLTSSGWIFTWETTKPSTFDRVEFPGKPPAGACNVLPADKDLKTGEPGVSVTQEFIAEDRYLHTLTWVPPACAEPCTYNFKVQSKFLSLSSMSSTHQLTVGFCGNFGM